MHGAGRSAAFALLRDLPRVLAVPAVIVCERPVPLDDAFAPYEPDDAAVDAGNSVGHGDRAILTRLARNIIRISLPGPRTSGPRFTA